MTTGYYLLDNPPARSQYRATRRRDALRYAIDTLSHNATSPCTTTEDG